MRDEAALGICRYCGCAIQENHEICTKCSNKVKAVRRLVKVGQELRELLDILKEKELRRRHNGNAR